MPAARPNIALRLLLLIFGVFCGSSAVILIKAGTEHPLLVAAYRLLLASLVLSPFFFRELKQNPRPYGWKQVGWSALPAVALAIHFSSWVVGARMTVVSNASLLTNLTPVAMPFFLWLVYREKINRLEVFGTAFAIAGLVILGITNFQVSQTSFVGDLICFASMLCFAAYLALGRRNSGRLGLWLYMVPLYFIAGLICLVSALPFINPIKEYTTANILLIIGLGLIPTVIGHTILNFSMKTFRGQVVSVANLGQIVFSVIQGYFFFAESPQTIFYLSAALIVTGVLIVLSSGYSRQEAKSVQ